MTQNGGKIPQNRLKMVENETNGPEIMRNMIKQA